MGTHDARKSRMRGSLAGWLGTSLLAMSAFSSAGGGTIVVGDVPPIPGVTTKPSLLSAVSMAADGDTIVVMPGFHPGLTYLPGNKRLTIVGSGPDVTTVEAIHSVNMIPGLFPETRDITIRGLRIVPRHDVGFGINLFYLPLRLENGDDTVLVEDCWIESHCGWPAVWTDNAKNVQLVRCVLTGGGGCAGELCGSCIVSDGGAGLRAIADSGVASRVSIVHCDLMGAPGYTSANPQHTGGDGGSGIEVAGATVVAIGTRFLGGDTGMKKPFGVETYVAGAGARIDSGELRHLDCEFVSGIVSDGGGGAVPPAIWTFGGGIATRVPGTPTLLTTAGKTAVGQSITIEVQGAPGSHALLFLGGATKFTPVPGYLLPLGLVPPPLLIPLGILPPSGIFSFTSTVPPLPVGVPSVSLGIQAATSGIGANSLSNTSVATLVVAGL
jgi:hypothetical protein